MIAIDTNVLVYAEQESYAQHACAYRLLKQLALGSVPWGIPSVCITEYVRIVSHPRLFKNPTSPAIAMENIQQLLSSPSASMLAPKQRFLSLFKQNLIDGAAKGNLVFDAQIAATCLENGASVLISEDRDFKRFADLKSVRMNEFLERGV